MPETPTTDPGARTRGSLRALLRDAWQVPLLLVGVAGIAGAVWFARAHKAENRWDEALAQASEQIEKDELAVARTIIDTVIAPHMGEAPEGFEPRFEAARADLASEELAASGKLDKESFEAVAKQYEHAIELGAELGDAQFARYMNALVGAGRESEAIRQAEAAGDLEHARKLASRFGRRQLEAAYDAVMRDPRKVTEFFEAYEDFRAADFRAADLRAADLKPAAGKDHESKDHESTSSGAAGVRRVAADDRAWAATLAARVRLARNDAAAAAASLQIDLPRAEAAVAAGEEVSAENFAVLRSLLGESFRRSDRLADAEHWLGLAREGVDASRVLAGEIDLALGRTLLALDRTEDAHAVLDPAVALEHPGDLKPLLLVERARARASLGRLDESLADFDTLLALSAKGTLTDDAAHGALDALNALAADAIGEERFDTAYALAERAASFDDDGARGAAALVRLAESAYRLAKLMRDREVERAGSLSAVDPGERVAINRMFLRAGEAFSDFLRTDAARDLSQAERAELHFSAGDCFDCAGESSLALSHFGDSLEELGERDTKRVERLLRMGDIQHAAGAFDKAVEAYEAIARITENDPRVAMRLCRVFADSDQAPRAIAELQRVLSGKAGLTPDSEQYLEALELHARMSRKRGDFVASAERLSELIERAPAAPQVGERSYWLADSLREIADAARAESRNEELTAARRAQLVRSAEERALEAQRAYQQSIERLESRGRALDALGRDMLANAYLQRAHCAFDRGDFREAIEFYETVDRKYADDVRSLRALVQIVNAADALGDTARAEAAHRLALRRIESLPEEAMLGPDGVFARDDWRTWLRRHPPGAGRIATGEGDGQAGRDGAP